MKAGIDAAYLCGSFDFMIPSKALEKAEARWLGKRVSVSFSDLPEKRGGQLVRSAPELATVTCVCDDSSECEGDRRRRPRPTGWLMVKLDRPSQQLEYEVAIEEVSAL